MDLIEQWFHISPDGGSGAIELLFGCLGLLVATGIVARRAFLRSVKPRRAG